MEPGSRASVRCCRGIAAVKLDANGAVTRGGTLSASTGEPGKLAADGYSGHLALTAAPPPGDAEPAGMAQ